MKILRYHYNDQECIGIFMNGNVLLLPEIIKGNSISNDILHIISNWNRYKKKIESAKITQENLITFNPKKLLAQIAQIVEGNGAKILSTLCLPNSLNSEIIEVLIKINQEELSGILQTFERYQYAIKQKYRFFTYGDSCIFSKENKLI